MTLWTEETERPARCDIGGWAMTWPMWAGLMLGLFAGAVVDASRWMLWMTGATACLCLLLLTWTAWLEQQDQDRKGGNDL